ncbi:MAG TPA: acetate kinase [Myxococcota bacterium]|nr:acetate kinase [Myxococcota bacterium]
MRILVLNVGSATLKAAMFDRGDDGLRELARVIEELHAGGPLESALARAIDELGPRTDAVEAVGHRVVHGGRRLQAPTRIDGAVEAELERLTSLAPLHQPAALEAIRIARRIFPERAQIAVFDTAFHASRSRASLHYALPDAWTQRFDLRRFGFHGIAHASLVEGFARQRNALPREIDGVTLQLGHGCSACAVLGGRSIETSMGFTPLEGLMMGTRSGDVDPGVLIHLLRSGIGLDELEATLQQRSGLTGIAGTADMRALLAAVERGEERADLALELFVHRIVLTVGAYLTLLGGPRALVFGGGIGENAPLVRAKVALGLRAWGMDLDEAANEAGAPGPISRPGTTPVHIVRTNEEAEIARLVATAVGAWDGSFRA